MYYKCKFTSPNCAYSTDAYDLKSNDVDEIIEQLENQGWEVMEVYDIKKQ